MIVLRSNTTIAAWPVTMMKREQVARVSRFWRVLGCGESEVTSMAATRKRDKWDRMAERCSRDPDWIDPEESDATGAIFYHVSQSKLAAILRRVAKREYETGYWDGRRNYHREEQR